MSHNISNIVIVGGGTAGWITAGILASSLMNKTNGGYQVTLIESPNVPTIGVGEGTWPTMRNTLKKMGIRETDFIRQCQVSFKQGAKFAKWVTGKDDDFYYHPLVLPQDHNHIDLVPHWLMSDKYTSYSNQVCPQEHLCELGLAPKKITTPEYAAVANYAYHLDAGAFSEFLKNHCINQLNVHLILADVERVNYAPNGDIGAVVTSDNREFHGDLFIDCTGFKSLLLGQALGVPFKTCSDSLFVDQAIAVQVPYDDNNQAIASHTLSTAQSAGWVWDIGLPTRRGVGHVFSSRHINEDKAYEELKRYLDINETQAGKLSFRNIPIEAGHRSQFWSKNCVAIGLSAGFLEPLEASALLLIEISAQQVADQLPANRVTMDIVAKRYNQTFLYRWQRIIDFLKLHYCLNQRNDNAFWVDHRDPATLSSRLKEQLLLWQYHTPCDADFESALEVFPAASYQYVLYGMGFKTQPPVLGLSVEQQKAAQAAFQKNQIISERLAAELLPNRELLNKIYQYGLQTV